MYSHTSGPRDSPKSAMNTMRPKIIRAFPMLLWLSLIRNPTATISSEMVATRVPACMIVLRPTLASKKLETRLAKTASKLRMTGITLAMLGTILATMSTP